MIDEFKEHGAIVFILPIIITWSIGLIPPLLIRFAIFKKQLSKKVAIPLSILFFFANIILFIAMGSETKVHSALAIIGVISYMIYRYRKKTPKEKQDEKAKSLAIAEKQKKNATDWDNNA